MNVATETMPPAAPRTAPVKATWVCLAIAWLTFLLPIPGIGLFIGWPLNLVAFVLAIVVMSRGYTAKGLIPLISSLVVSPIVYFVGVAILAGAAGAASKSAETSAATTAAAPAAQEAAAAVAADVPAVTAAELARAYDANTVAADQRFKDKQFKVTGVVGDINTDILGNPYVTLGGGVNEFMEPQFKFDEAAKDQLAQLSKGMEVTLVCTGRGDVAKTPMSDECSMQ
ncbi:MAG TPA: hypothetical protein VIG88_13965 [Lysobacter sp.]